MPLTHIFLQKITRARFNTAISVIRQSAPTSTEGAAYAIFEQAKHAAYRSANKQIGCFDAAAENQQLPTLIKRFLADNIDFVALSCALADFLAQQMDGIEEPFCYVLFSTIETIGDKSSLYLFLLPEQEIYSVATDVSVISQQMLVADKPHFALTLRIDDFVAKTNDFITITLQRGNPRFTDAVLQFSGFVQQIDNKQQTTDFLQKVDAFSAQLPQESYQKARKTILDYCVKQDKSGQPVSSDALSMQLAQDQQAPFQQFFPPQEIYTHRPSLKRYMRFFGRDNSLSISFSADRIQQDIVYDATTGSLHISKLPSSLKQQLSSFAVKPFSSNKKTGYNQPNHSDGEVL